MKTIIKYTVALFILTLFVQCEKLDEVQTADLQVTMITAPEDVARSAVLQFDVACKAEHLVFYNGNTALWENYPADRGTAVLLPANRNNVTVNVSYNKVGTFKLTWVATSYGNYLNEMKQDIIEMDIVIPEDED